jgi:hypothetical protein
MAYYKNLASAITQLANNGLTVTFHSYATGLRMTITDGTDTLVDDGATAQDAWLNARDKIKQYWDLYECRGCQFATSSIPAMKEHAKSIHGQVLSDETFTAES